MICAGKNIGKDLEHPGEGQQGTARCWLLLLVALLCTGCTGRVIQPVNLTEPVTLYLIDHGRHSSLVLPREDGVVRYAYGEWEWYVKDRRGTLAGMSAMLWPTRGALGRKVFPGIGISPFPSRVAPEGIEEVFALQAETTLVRRLEHDLDEIFDEGGKDMLHHSSYDLEFVPYPKPYWFGHQSNQVTAEWLRQLGFTVRGVAWFSDWQVERPPQTSDAKKEGSPGSQIGPAPAGKESIADG